MKRAQYILFSLLVSVAFVGVSHARPRPQLFPNAKLESVSAAQLNRDIGGCETRARSFEQQNSQGVVRQGVGRAARGAALGALGGAIAGNAGRGAGAGAAIAGTSSVLDSRQQRKQGSPEFRNFMEACLEDMGYRVVGWQ